MMNEPISHCEP